MVTIRATSIVSIFHEVSMARGRKKKSVSTKVEDLNLVPMMNMVVCLIPVVLFGTSLIKIGVVDVSSKFGNASAKADDKEKEKTLGLTIGITDKAFIVKSQGGVDVAEMVGGTPGEELKIPKAPAMVLAGDPPREVEVTDYDYRTLYNYAVKFKRSYPKETMVTITADPGIAYKHVIALIDVLRERLEQDEYSDNRLFRDAKMKDGSSSEKYLYNHPVLGQVQ
jgi:biopolymer transport protein ExbD